MSISRATTQLLKSLDRAKEKLEIIEAKKAPLLAEIEGIEKALEAIGSQEVRAFNG